MHEPYSLQLCKLCVILQSLAHHVMTCQRKFMLGLLVIFVNWRAGGECEGELTKAPLILAGEASEMNKGAFMEAIRTPRPANTLPIMTTISDTISSCIFRENFTRGVLTAQFQHITHILFISCTSSLHRIHIAIVVFCSGITRRHLLFVSPNSVACCLSCLLL
jgi:hypothetical protein